MSHDSIFQPPTTTGSISLTALASVLGGVMFTLLFANLVRYISAENALEQSVQRIARCVNPTDPECAETTVEATPIRYDWYLAERRRGQTTWVDRFRYTGKVFEQSWLLRFPGYEIRKVPLPPVEWRAWSVPVRTFRAGLNGFERRTRRVSALLQPSAERYAPLAEPNFPELDPYFERVMRDRDPGEWTPRALDVRGDVRRTASSGYVSHEIGLPAAAVFTDSKPLSDRHGDGAPEAQEFVSDIVEVPELGLENPQTAVCRGTLEQCAVSYAAGGTAPWYDSAYIAVKAFAKLSRTAGSPEVKWAGSPEHPAGTPDGWGLQIETVGRDSFRAWKTERDRARAEGRAVPDLSMQVECLGGREWSELPTNGAPKDFHLILRGAIKRDTRSNSADVDDGSSAACPNEDRKHWGLRVERGGAYRIRGYLKIRGGAALATVHFWSYFDNYQRLAGSDPVRCDGIVPLTPEETTPDCPFEAACPNLLLLPKSGYRVASCTATDERTPVCPSSRTSEAMAGLFPVEETEHCTQRAQVASCGDNSTPSTPPDCPDLPQGRILCPWMPEDGPEKGVVVATKPASCPVAAPTTFTAGCGDGRALVTFRPDGNYGDPLRCPSVQDAIGAMEKGRALVGNSISVEQPEVSWRPVDESTPLRWEKAASPFDEDGTVLSSPLVIREATVELPSIRLELQRSDASWVPGLDVFGLTPAEQALVATRPGLTRVPVSVSERSIEHVYPFSRSPEFEISDLLLSDRSSCAGRPAPLDERLRAFAAAEVAAANDPSVRFEGTAEYIDSQRIFASGGCRPDEARAVSVPACTKVSITEHSGDLCPPSEYLGRFDASAFPDGPSECAREGIECLREAVVENITDRAPRTEVDIERARSKGFEEISRAFAGASLGCEDIGCFNAEIDTSAAETSITARYEMPLTFPLDLITGRDRVSLRRSKQEIREVAAVGRNRQTTGEDAVR